MQVDDAWSVTFCRWRQRPQRCTVLLTYFASWLNRWFWGFVIVLWAFARRQRYSARTDRQGAPREELGWRQDAAWLTKLDRFCNNGFQPGQIFAISCVHFKLHAKQKCQKDNTSVNTILPAWWPATFWQAIGARVCITCCQKGLGVPSLWTKSEDNDFATGPPLRWA